MAYFEKARGLILGLNLFIDIVSPIDYTPMKYINFVCLSLGFKFNPTPSNVSQPSTFLKFPIGKCMHAYVLYERAYYTPILPRKYATPRVRIEPIIAPINADVIVDDPTL